MAKFEKRDHSANLWPYFKSRPHGVVSEVNLERELVSFNFSTRVKRQSDLEQRTIFMWAASHVVKIAVHRGTTKRRGGKGEKVFPNFTLPKGGNPSASVEIGWEVGQDFMHQLLQKGCY